MTPRTLAAAAVILPLLLAAPARGRADDGFDPRLTPAEERAADGLVARILAREFRLGVARAPKGGRRVVVEVRAYTPRETGDGGVRLDARWDRTWGEGLRSLDELSVTVRAVQRFCGGEGRIYVVTVTSPRSPEQPLSFGSMDLEGLKRREYLPAHGCLE